ncbi:MAG TPA: 3-keto-5-aminohexanoate cleavage protein [Bryocella sp.]|nr:3-keto-5-aminohexanoate cleavage protein [Bryocella sp.]
MTCAVTGAIHTPSMSPYLPITPEEISTAALDAAEAGAAVVHIHARNPVDGRPDQSVEAFQPIVAALRSNTNAVLNITTGGSPFMMVEERICPAAHFKPELASLNMGSLNFGLYPMLQRFQDFRFSWEGQALEDSRDLIFRNTFQDIEYVLATLRAHGTKFEFECYDVGHLYNLAHFLDRGLVEPPLFVQTIFGVLGGIGTHPDDVETMQRTANRLFGDDFFWSVLGTGKSQMEIAKLALREGGFVRVGLEDSLWIAPGRLAQSNAEQVAMVCEMVAECGRTLATPDDARELLGLKGAAATGW